jgi:ribosomal protein S18 acetylase RimI-like enzyme
MLATDLRPYLDSLAELLVDAATSGASVGFLPPITLADASAYWDGVAQASDCLCFVAVEDSQVLGTVQLQLATKANASHRAEIAKLLVHTKARRQGLGRRLMLEAEAAARERGRTTLVLDTRQGDVSEKVYQQIGYTFAGAIPQFARSANGELHATALYYKLLT